MGKLAGRLPIAKFSDPHYVCPSCGRLISQIYAGNVKQCPQCGQRFRTSERG